MWCVASSSEDEGGAVGGGAAALNTAEIAELLNKTVLAPEMLDAAPPVALSSGPAPAPALAPAPAAASASGPAPAPAPAPGVCQVLRSAQRLPALHALFLCQVLFC
jgi:hypothetical protein